MTLAAAQPLYAQYDEYRFDIGGAVGMSGYLGDANQSNMFRHPGIAASALVRYKFDSKWALRGDVSVLQAKGDISDFDNVFPSVSDYRFSSSVYGMSVRGEYNFFAYGIGETYKHLRRWTPVISLGAGICLSDTGSGTYAAMTLPMGVGVRYKVGERLNLGAEWCIAKTFGDSLDGSVLDDPYGIKSSFLKNTDWYSTLSVSVSYEFGKRCATCHRIEYRNQ